jgi:hypothetical protein
VFDEACVVVTQAGPRRAGQPHLTHQPAHAAARRAQVLAAHLPPDLARAVDLVMLDPDASNDRP